MYFVVAGMKNVFFLLSYYYGLYLYIFLWHYKFYLCMETELLYICIYFNSMQLFSIFWLSRFVLKNSIRRFLLFISNGKKSDVYF